MSDMPFPVPRDGDTHDLADQMRRAQEQNEIADLLAARQNPRPSCRYLMILGVTAAVTVGSWGLLATAIAGHEGPRLGLAIAIPLAVAAVLTLTTIGLAGLGVLIYVIRTLVGQWDRIAAWDRATADEKMSALVERVTQLQRLVGLMSGMSNASDRQQAWDDFAQTMRDDLARAKNDRNAPPEGVIPIVSGRPARNRSSS